MKLPPAEWLWLDEFETVSRAELLEVCKLSTDELDELVDYGALMPLPSRQAEARFSAQCLLPLRDANRMAIDYDFDLFTVGTLLGLLGRIDMLERRLQAMAVHPSRYTPPSCPTISGK
jgi:chaperone modulatory protein CbpM